MLGAMSKLPEGAREARAGVLIARATRLFAVRCEVVGPAWQSFRAVLGGVGRTGPRLRPEINGMEGSFRTMLGWFAPFCAVVSGGP
jgi:hypothetical protein